MEGATRPTDSEMTSEDRLKAVLYQFITLYERWAEDRQLAVKQGADIAQLVAVFVEQVKNFQALESNVRQKISHSIENASSSAVKLMGEEISKEAARSVKDTTRQLSTTVEAAERTLNAYQNELVTIGWKVILTTMVTSVVTCLLLVWLLIPKATLPLTDQQLMFLNEGQLTATVWPKLSQKEQQRWQALADQTEHPQQTDENSTLDNN